MIKSLRFQKTYNISRAELIGQGNFAKVYRVFDDSLGKYIAIRKVIKSKEDQVDIQKERQINEQLKKCSSPYILQIYEIIDGVDCLYYLTEYCEGQSLWHALNNTKNHKFSQEQTLKCILHIARGVQQLHNQRITHRDLKPENILLTSKYIKGKQLPDLKIADFGLSTKSIIMETVAGTKQYIAPQQAKFNTYTNAVDVWSLGIIFDQLLHGQPFYTGADNKQVFDKVIKVEYTVRNTNLSKPIQDLLLKIIKKKAYERPIIAVIINDIQQILKVKQNPIKQQIRPRSQTNLRTFQNKQNRFNRISREQSIEQHHQSRQDKIPLFKLERRKTNNLNKRRKQTSTKQYKNTDDFINEIFKQQQNLLSCEIKLKPFEFNPNMKLTFVDHPNTQYALFTQQKRKFQYLNQIRHDQSYQIQLSKTQHNIQQCKCQLSLKKQQIHRNLKQQLLNQIDLYVQDLMNKCLQ